MFTVVLRNVVHLRKGTSQTYFPYKKNRTVFLIMNVTENFEAVSLLVCVAPRSVGIRTE